MGYPELGYVSLAEVHEVIAEYGLTPQCRIMNAIYKIDDYAEIARQKQTIVMLSERDKGRNEIPLTEFLHDFHTALLDTVAEQLPPLFDDKQLNHHYDTVLNDLSRQPLGGQREKIHAVLTGLIDQNLEAVILNGEMGTGKTFMSIAAAAVYHRHNRKPILVMCPPHLVYKWRREILATIDNAKVTVINGSDAINKLLKLREDILAGRIDNSVPNFVVIGRVRMRMGFHWRPAYLVRKMHRASKSEGKTISHTDRYIACPSCGAFFCDSDGNPIDVEAFEAGYSEKRQKCQKCKTPLWTMHHRANEGNDNKEKQLMRFLRKLPGIGKVTAAKLVHQIGVDQLSGIIDDNIYDFVNIYHPERPGEFYFSDKQAMRLERSLGRLEFALRFISYQPSEFVKRYFPRKFFGLAIADEAHEYKNAGSAQGQAMAVLCSASDKVLPLTGTLMGGYASDLFHLLWRIMPSFMRSEGFSANQFNSLGTAEMDFMQRFGVLIQIRKISEGPAYKTAKGNQQRVSTKKAPGFSPLGIAKHVLPFTVFMRLSDLGDGVLPEYEELTHTVSLPADAQGHYQYMEKRLVSIMREALRKNDNSLVGVVMNFLLRWPDTAFRDETVKHPHTGNELLFAKAAFDAKTPTPKERDCIDQCLEQHRRGRRVIVYTTYTGKHDTMTRLKGFLSEKGLKVAVLRSSIKTDEREDWIADKVEQGIDVLITNPELVKTGLDLLWFPTLYFMQTGVNTYTLEQASRRSWRIGQQHGVEVYFGCFEQTSQTKCLALMSNKIKVSQSTSGVMPETGLDVFEEEADNSILFEMAKDLVKANTK